MMNTQLDRWKGSLGNDYTRRSRLSNDIITKRARTFRDIFGILDGDPTSILEIGCNMGGNLLALKFFVNDWNTIVGVEPNDIARRIAELNSLRVYPDCGQELHFLDSFFDLVFTCGVLIHCELPEAEKIVREMNRVSGRLIMFMEYDYEEDIEIPYRGESKLLWKRPWLKHFGSWGFVNPVATGFLPPENGFDSVHFWVYKKVN